MYTKTWLNNQHQFTTTPINQDTIHLQEIKINFPYLSLIVFALKDAL